ncbi:uncharacterized protein MYCFIDRAFT_83158 [Pseudocercospora fijiensis CIRAD86]|uniref:BTB domain-containing protein n=1 Tax=Pseudocercospora fijiensis (strain CIRAD86) TaxID=383855 RepID=M3A1V4_PSEFD|nr:uncharacterized protein MYCFIDRAFT_83158 [Pseudocercospora fijiensis CIRAD86]EME85149.1 hypothetical protein MYCFIDRAFT_83158 [Pseudocercospora fijiensis CIRAD86]
MHWAYSRKLEIALDDIDASCPLLLQLWVFGDAHEIPLLQNDVMTALHRIVSKDWAIPDVRDINYVYENTMRQSPLRRFLIDVYAATCNSDSFERYGEKLSWCKDALLDLLQVVWREGWHREAEADFGKWDLRKYHVHEQGVECGGSEAR